MNVWTCCCSGSSCGGRYDSPNFLGLQAPNKALIDLKKKLAESFSPFQNDHMGHLHLFVFSAGSLSSGCPRSMKNWLRSWTTGCYARSQVVIFDEGHWIGGLPSKMALSLARTIDRRPGLARYNGAARAGPHQVLDSDLRRN